MFWVEQVKIFCKNRQAVKVWTLKFPNGATLGDGYSTARVSKRQSYQYAAYLKGQRSLHFLSASRVPSPRLHFHYQTKESL
jgi:hypothetical protein